MSKALGPHTDVKEFTAFGADIDLKTNGVASPNTRHYPEGATAIFNTGAAGDIAVVTSTGETRLITAVPAGSLVQPSPFYVVAILAAGTTVVKVVVGWG